MVGLEQWVKRSSMDFSSSEDSRDTVDFSRLLQEAQQQGGKPLKKRSYNNLIAANPTPPMPPPEAPPVSDLRRALGEWPSRFNYRWSKEADIELKHALFLAASKNGVYIKQFFPELDKHDLTDLSSHPSARVRSWTMNTLSEDGTENKYHRGRPCVRKFQKGQPTYRCLTCGLDATCVLCQHCYNPEDHVGHQVAVQISQRDCGGVCDCGDPEAWVKQFSCKWHALGDIRNGPLVQEFSDAILDTIRTALDYTIDVFSNSNPEIYKYTRAQEVLLNERNSALSEQVYGVKDDELVDGTYVLCVWNDQKHSPEDYVTIISNVTKKRPGFATMVVKQIESNGRARVMISDKLHDLLDSKKQLEPTGLTVSIRSSRDYFREEMCGTICSWLEDLSKTDLPASYTALRKILCEALCEQWSYGTKVLRDQGTLSSTSPNVYAEKKDSLDTSRTVLDNAYIPRLPDSIQLRSYPDDFSDDEYDEMDPANDDDYDEDETDIDRMQAIGERDGDAAEQSPDSSAAETDSAGLHAHHPRSDAGPKMRVMASGKKVKISRGDQDLFANGTHIPIAANGAVDFETISDESLGIALQSTFTECVKDDEQVWVRATDKQKDTGPSVSLRVQYLIFFDIRLWKHLRLSLRDLYVAVLVSDPDYKLQLGRLYAELYPQIAELYMLIDREPECSIISSLSTQLFTTPSIATDLMERDYFTKFMAALYTFFTTHRIGSPKAVNVQLGLYGERVLRNRRFGQLFNEFEYLLNRNEKKALVSCNENHIEQLADFVLMFQGTSPIRRQQLKHIEYESDSWVSYFNGIPYILRLAAAVAYGLSSCQDSALVSRCIARVAEKIGRWATGLYAAKFSEPAEGRTLPQFRVAGCEFANRHVSSKLLDFSVHDEEVSLHHPLHAFLSDLIEHGHLKNRRVLRNALLNLPEGASAYSGNRNADIRDSLRLQVLLDHPLRVLGLLSQIKIGLWVRNGYSVRTQLHHYRELTLRDSAYVRDVFMAQVALVAQDPGVAFLQLQSRWSLDDWQNSPLFDDIQRMYMVEEFLHHLIFFATERTALRGLSEEEAKREYIRCEIIQSLGMQARSFSELCKRSPESLTSDEKFETNLRELATFKPPASIRDVGSYQLKDEYFKYFDTHYIHFTAAKIEEAQTTIRMRLAKLTGADPKSVVHEPVLKPLSSGPFVGLTSYLRTIPFARFAFDVTMHLHRCSSDTQYDGVMGNLLQLLHVAVVDDLSREIDPEMEESIDCYPSVAALICDHDSETDASILALLCELAQVPEYDDTVAKIRRIVSLAHKKDARLVEETLTSCRISSIDSIGPVEPVMPSQNADAGESETTSERKKKLAQLRKEQVMAEFQKKQQQFAERNLATGMDVDDDDDELEEPTSSENGWQFPDSHCILCRMPNDKDNVFGLISFVSPTNVVRNMPFDDPQWVFEAYGCDQDLDDDIVDEVENGFGEPWQSVGTPQPGQSTSDSSNKTAGRPAVVEDMNVDSQEGVSQHAEFFHNHNIGPGFPRKYATRRSVFTGCGHGMHFKCYENYLRTSRTRGQPLIRNNPENRSRGEFLCPLCRSLNNTFLPILWKSNNRSAREYLEGSSDRDSSSQSDPRDPYSAPATLDVALDRMTMSLKDSGEWMSYLPSRLYTSARQGLRPEFKGIFGPGDLTAQQNVARGMLQAANGTSITLQKEFSSLKDQDSFHIKPFISTFANTLSTLEIALRGKGHTNPMGGIIVDQVPSQPLQVLRTCAEMGRTVVASLATMGKNALGRTVTFGEMDDLFGDFVAASFITGPSLNIPPGTIVKLFYVACIANTIQSVALQVAEGRDWVFNERLPELPTVPGGDNKEVLHAVEELLFEISNYGAGPGGVDRNALLARVMHPVIVKSVTPFLRKCAMFVFAMCGVYEPYDFMGFDKTTPEHEKLSEYLGVQDMNATFKSMVDRNSDEYKLLVWYLEHGKKQFRFGSENVIEYPGVVRLLRLPHRLDEFFSLQPKLVADQGSDPAVCLFCGEIVSMQALAEGTSVPIGQCNYHVGQCGKDLGIFLLPKRSAMLLLKGNQGSYIEAPYLDVHGETDETMRRGRPQFLQPKRYDHFIRMMWQQHGIPSFIARKLDSNVDNGGWETL